MPRRGTKRTARESGGSNAPFLFDDQTWTQVVEKLELPPQQARIVKGILHGMNDKQIAHQLGLSVPTVRTYLGRIFDRLRVDDRVQVILRVVAQAWVIASDCNRQR